MCAGLRRSRRAAISAPMESGSGISAPSLSRLAAAGDQQVTVLQQPHELLGEEGVAAGGLEELGLELRRQRLGAEAGDYKSACLLAGERAEGKVCGRRHKASAGAAQLRDLGAGARQDEQRHGGLTLRQVVHEGGHGLIGPVQVLDHQDGGIGGGGPSRNSRQAAKFSSREASSASRPSSGRRRERRRSRSGPWARIVSRRASVRATPSLSSTPAESRTISESAQKVTPAPKGRQRPWRQVTTVGRSSRRRANSASRRLLPMPGSPRIRAKRGAGSRPRHQAGPAGRRAPPLCRRTRRRSCAAPSRFA